MNEPVTLPIQTFWSWLTTHPNCILRAGSPDAVIYDDDDLHWHFATEGPETLLVQILRGKRLTAEILVQHEAVSYVQGGAGDNEGEFLFELMTESEKDHLPLYFFVLAHGYEETEQDLSPGRVH